MTRARAQRQKGQRGRDDSAREAAADSRVEKLRQAFAQFRRTHRPRTRYPQSLRAAVLAALGGGVSEPELLRACKLSADQLAAWRRREGVPVSSGEPVRQAARVFSVVDEVPEASVDDASEAVGDDLELRIGGWAVRIRRADG